MTTMQAATQTTAAPFDAAEALAGLLADVGLSPADAGGEVELRGEDPILDSRLRLGAAIGIPIMAAAVGTAAIWKLRAGRGQGRLGGAQRSTVDQFAKPRRQAVGVSRREKCSGLARHLAVARRIGGHDRHCPGHRLDQREAERLDKLGKDEGIERIVDLGDIAGAGFAFILHHAGQAEGRGAAKHARIFGKALVQRQNEPDCAPLLGQPGDGGKQHLEIFWTPHFVR